MPTDPTPSGSCAPPERCLYCDGSNPDCGFCDMGQPLDTPDDWRRTWGKALGLLRPVNGPVDESADVRGQSLA